jgi:hypothetical protein
MERFRLDYERSLALHQAVALELRRHPKIPDRARRKTRSPIASLIAADFQGSVR